MAENGTAESTLREALRRSAVLPFLLLLFTLSALPQRLAVIAPDRKDESVAVADSFRQTLAASANVLDTGLADAAFSATAPALPFNMTTSEAQRVGSAMGCDMFVLVRAAWLRRSSSTHSEYYEAHAAFFLVSGRSGRLVYWKLNRSEATTLERARTMLLSALPGIAAHLAAKVKEIAVLESRESPPRRIETPPADGSAEAKNFRAPIPFRRIKPQYTAEAYLYEVEASVEVEVDLDAAGTVLRTEVVRWAGYGLDESAVDTIRSMNWRPAERNGKPLPMRFLVRYNFKKTERE